jgi:hypothetical protein
MNPTPARQEAMLQQIRSLRERIGAHEVRALFPPADCSNKALYVEVEQTAIVTLSEEITALESQLAAANAQLSLAL